MLCTTVLSMFSKLSTLPDWDHHIYPAQCLRSRPIHGAESKVRILCSIELLRAAGDAMSAGTVTTGMGLNSYRTRLIVVCSPPLRAPKSRRSGSFGKLFHEWRMPEDGRQCLHPVSCSASSYSKLHIVSCHAIPSCWFYLSVFEVWFNMGVTEKGKFVRVAKPEKSEPQCKQFGLATPPESDPFHPVSGHHTRLSQKLRSKCLRMLGFPGKWSFCKCRHWFFHIFPSPYRW